MSNPSAAAGHDRGVWQESSDDKHGQMTAKKIQRRLLILYAAKTSVSFHTASRKLLT